MKLLLKLFQAQMISLVTQTAYFPQRFRSAGFENWGWLWPVMGLGALSDERGETGMCFADTG